MELPTLYTTDVIIDQVPHGLPLTCLRKIKESQCWRLKTANENGVRQTDYTNLDDLDSIEKAMLAWRRLHPMAVGHIVLCSDGESYSGLELMLSKVFPEGHIQKHIPELIFPWSTKPKY